MAVYVDNARIPWRGKLWCHLVADSVDELHLFASRLGLRRSWFQKFATYPHYDVTVECRKNALALGAFEGTRPQIITCGRQMKFQLLEANIGNQRQLSLFL